LTLALEAGATETRIFFVRSRIRQQLGDLAGSRQDHEEGLRRQPSDEKSGVARGIARLSSDPRAALADFRRALQLNPQSRDARQNIAHVLAERMHKPQEAIAVLDELVESEPGSPQPLVARAVLHARMGNRGAAVGDAEQAVQLASSADERCQVQYQAGCVYALTSKQHPGDVETAIDLVVRAIRFDPRWRRAAVADPDLNALRKNDRFLSLLATFDDLDKMTTQH
jgi:tetratricopeptide (TPR) repeat protein